MYVLLVLFNLIKLPKYGRRIKLLNTLDKGVNKAGCLGFVENRQEMK